MSSATAIEVFADVWCPFAHLGLRAVVGRCRERGRQNPPLLVRAWPLELVNGAPLDPAVTLRHVDELRAQVAPGLFVGFDVDQFPTTSLPALALASAGYRQSPETGESVNLALRTALFEQGRNIEAPTVLAEIAQSCGLHLEPTSMDHSSVLADWREGQARGVKGSPHFYCGEASVFCPSLDISKGADGHLSLHRDAAALDDFLDSCFAGSA